MQGKAGSFPGDSRRWETGEGAMSVTSCTQVGDQPSSRKAEVTQAFARQHHQVFHIPLPYLMALLNRVEEGLLGTWSLRYPYFSRNAWGRDEQQLSSQCSILSPS